jgi:cytochrome c oxidase cbb3-type subunit IV
MKIDLNLARGIITVLWFILFVAIWAAAWSRNRHQDFRAAAQLPLERADSVTPSTKEPQ